MIENTVSVVENVGSEFSTKQQNHSIASLESYFPSQRCVSCLYQRQTGVFQQHARQPDRKRLWFPTSIIPNWPFSVAG